jgi:hypothetical protein
VLTRWLLNTFPRDMRAGWRLIAPDLIFWLAAAAVLVALAYVEPLISEPHATPGAPGSDGVGAAAAGLLRRLVAPLVFVAAALRFRAARDRRALPWADTAAAAARRIVPTALAWLGAAGLCLAGAVAAQIGVLLMFRSGDETSDTLGAASMAVRSVVFAALLARFVFVPYLAALHTGRELAPADPYSVRVPRLLYRAIWPLVESSRMTAGAKWQALPYLLLGIYAPLLAVAMPALARPVVSFALHMVAFTALAALFRHYDERLGVVLPDRARGPAPLPA